MPGVDGMRRATGRSPLQSTDNRMDDVYRQDIVSIKNDLPKNWAQTTIGDIFDFQYGKSLPQKKRNPRGQYPVFGANGQVGKHNEYLVKGPGIIIGRKGGAGEVTISNENFWPIDTTYFVIPPNGIDLKYAYYLLSQAGLNQLDKSTAIPGLNRNDAYELSVPLPPLPEQHRIVSEIERLFSELDKGVAELKKAKEKLELYRQSLLKAAFEGRLTEQWRKKHADELESAEELLVRIKAEREKRYQQQFKEWKQAVKEWEAQGKPGKKPKKPRKPKELPPLTEEELAELPELPDGWGWFRVAHLCEVVRGGSPRPAGDPKYYGGNIPFLKVADITGDTNPYLQSFTFTIKEAGLTKTRLVKANTLLLSNSGATLGVPKICTFETTFNDGIAAFLGVDEDLLLYHYYFWMCNTRKLRSVNQGAAQPNLNTNLIKEYLFPVCSKAEMIAVADKLHRIFSTIDNLENTLQRELSKAETLRQSILKKAFSGKLVPQDPNDLPAPRPGKWFVYALECNDGSIYIGQTQDIEKRWAEHATGKGAEWTKRHPPIKLMHWEEFDSLQSAVKREKELKTGFGRKWLKREYAAGRTRQAGEPASILLKRIRAEREKVRATGRSPQRRRRK